MVRVQQLTLFLPVFAVIRCMSVCPPRSCIVSRCLKISYRHLFRPGSAITLVFLTSSADTQLQGEPVSLVFTPKHTGSPLKLVIGMLEKFEKHGGWKNVRLSTEIAVYLVNGTT